MPTTRADIITSSEQVFDLRGFAATGMDTLTETAKVSSRTLYKHVGSKAGLTVAVLEARMGRFFETCSATTVDELFDGLEEWVESEGARGCLFLRAQGESGSSDSAISAVVTEYRRRLRELIGHLITENLGHEDAALSDEVLIAFEGATSAASYLGPRAVSAARSAANTLLTRGTPCTC